ncbi:alpha-hydroxy acid oxidase [Kitasatospora aburaviensis]
MSAADPRTAPRQALTLDDYAALAREGMDPGSGTSSRAAPGRSGRSPRTSSPSTGGGAPGADRGGRGRHRRHGARPPLGRPVGVAPMAYHTLVHPGGETATVQAAGVAGLPVVVSTFAGQPFDKLAAAANSPLWLQVYCFRDRSVTRRLVERAAEAGFEALVLTVDTPRLGRRLRDLRNGFRLPEGIVPANLPPGDYSSPSGHSRTELDPALDWSVVSWLKSVSPLPVLLKGVTTGEDAARALDAGADGLVVSNHGGRQLDGAHATVDVLAEVAVAAAGRCPVLLDGGVRRGTDVLTALALGADAVLLGRPVLHGLAVAGQSGVADVFDILVGELADALLLTGTPSAAAAGPALLSPAGAGPVPTPATAVPARPAADPAAPVVLRKEELHASLGDPVLDTMNFLNEVTTRYPGPSPSRRAAPTRASSTPSSSSATSAATSTTWPPRATPPRRSGPSSSSTAPPPG